MRSNGLLKWLMIPVAILVLFAGIRLFSGGGGTAPPAADNGAQLTPEEMKALGIEGDTPRDTVATLVAQVKQLRTELQTALSDNKSQREENQRLRQRENSIDQRINSALESERSNLRRDQEQAASARQQTEGLLADLQRRLDSIGRGQVRSITFVFNDGTIRTIPEDREGNQQNNQQRDGLGWISDPHGIPCVSGERRSNAQQYLGSQALITAAGAGVASLIESGSGRMSYVGSDGSIGTVGITGQEAVGQILAGGVRDMSAWVNKLYGQAFAAVYVQPGAKVAVHLEKPLAIDFDPEGRKVDHRAGESHALELD